VHGVLFCYLIVKIDDSVMQSRRSSFSCFLFSDFLVISRILKSTFNQCGGNLVTSLGSGGSNFGMTLKFSFRPTYSA
jgi:hypothetical protein